jgi:hypothetical protein
MLALAVTLLLFGASSAGAGPAKPFHTAAAATAFSDCPNQALRSENNSAALPDCRAYEQVSPLDKGGFAAYPRSAFPAQTSPSGEKIVYEGYSSFPGAEGNTAVAAAHLSSRTASGWQTTELVPATPSAKVLRLFEVGYAFSEGLDETALKVPLVPVTPEATPNVYNLFLRHADGTYSWINAATPALSAEQLCPEPEELASCFEIADLTAFAGGSADFSHVLFESNAQLTPQAPPTGIESLYEGSGGQVRLVGFLPDGQPAASSTAGAGSSVYFFNSPQATDRRIEHAISADGSHVVFGAPSDEGEPGEAGQAGLTEVYDRVDSTETVELSAPAPGANPASPAAASATFWAASKDGSRVFFTSAAELTSDSRTGEGGEDLYEYDFDKPAAERLTDLSVDANPADAAAGATVQGVVNTSVDGSYVYFVAKGQFEPALGADGEPNLYMSHDGGAPVFIATLSGAGNCSFGTEESADSCDWTPFSPQLEAYVAPDGRHLAFMSTQSLPAANFPAGYDNTDRGSGEADSEVYEYSAPTASEEAEGEAGQLLCGSCIPSGEQPLGNAQLGGISQTEEEPLPGRQPYVGISTPFYRVPSLSENGARLFYTAPVSSAEPKSKVFEYERGGEGSCSSPGGCQYLISDPTSGEAEQFLGAGPGGRDVFLATASRLAAGDEDNLIDVYDAREEGGFAAPAPAPPCVGEGCAGAASNPPAPSLAATASFAGPEEGPAHRECAKRRVKRHGRCVNTENHRSGKRRGSHRRGRADHGAHR